MELEPLWVRECAERDGLEVVVFTQPAVNLALVHNRIPLVQAVAVRNTGDVPLVDVTVDVALHGQGEALADPWSRTHEGEIAPGQEVTWADFGSFHPRHEHLAALNESHPSTLQVVATRTWGEEVDLAVPVSVLAHNEWFNAPIFYGSLAAFVQPNTSAVRAVLDDAAELLRAETGDASVSGYQDGSERAAIIAAAIYEALHRRQIRYINPSPSFENTGQKILTTAQVLDGRFGTCVDLSVTYAACLELAGLRPLLWLVEGHAFAGFMREDDGLPQAVVTEPNALVNLVESGRAVPVEAVFYGDGEEHRFASAVATAKRRFSAPESLFGLVAVTGTRRDGIRPLPSEDEAELVVAPPEVMTVVPGGALDLPPELRSASEGDNVLLDTSDDAPARVTKWKRSLLDLSTRNRLLNLRASAQVLDLHVPSGALPTLDDLVHAGRSVKLRAQDTLSDVHRLQGARRAQDVDAVVLTRLLREDHTIHAAITEARYQRGLRALHRTSRTMLEETGNANLYLTFGALVHRTSGDREARAPLFLVPARIEGGSGRSEFRVTVDPSNVATPNHCLVEWLRIKHDVRIEALERPKLDDSGIDVAHALPAIRAALLQHDLDFRIDEVAALAICQFSTFGLWQDLEKSWDILQRSPVVQHLALHAGDSFRDPAEDEVDIALQDFDEADIAVPIPADGSQLRAVALAAAGRTFVLEGPPGTGKSQTITNLIAHALDRGKTVLFVAEKQAALDVVKRRLDAAGLSAFTLDLHGKDQQPAVIRQQLKRAIDNEATYEQRGWAAKLATFRSRHAPLAEYPDKIHARNGLDYSLWSAAESLRQVGEGPSAPVPSAFVLRPGLTEDEVGEALQGFARASRATQLTAAHPWSLVGGVADELDAEGLSGAADAVNSAFERLVADADAQRTAQLASSAAELATLLPHLRERLEHEGFDETELERVRTIAWKNARSALVEETTRFQEQHSAVLAIFTSAFLEDGDIVALSALADDAQKGILGKKKRLERFAGAVDGLTQTGSTVEPQQIAGLALGIVAARDHARRLASDLEDVLHGAAPAHWSPLRSDASPRLADAFAAIDRAVAFADEHPELWRRLEEHGAPGAASVRLLEEVATATADWSDLLRSDPLDVARWSAGRTWTDAWTTDVETWVAGVRDGGDTPVRRWAQMAAFLDPLRDAGLDDLREELLTARLAAGDAEVAFFRGAATASVRERRAAAGLDVFDTALRNGEIEDFGAAAASLRDEQIVALPASLLARRSFQAGRLSGSVGELRRQLDAKRKGASFRQLIQRHGEEILEATPCFFVSPTSLAQFVPPGAVTFDLVVFDEASQVTVPQAIGALGRGRSAVIVGDSQQMPPTAVGKVSMTDGADEQESGDAAPEDLESILSECVESGLPRLWLSWHYRSQDETLIAFSNQHYYEGNLASLPSPGGDPTAGVELRRVDGHFNREDTKNEHRTNRVEAEAIVDEIRARLSNAYLAAQTIGVVTFNSQQRDLVLNLLEDCGDPLVAAQLREDAVEGIFVKNLENVQGDERDVVLFSTAFSKRPGDPRLPLNFGPITQQGGEKRLNVAVTRARRKVVLFTSFDPADIDLTRTSSRGLAHLRAYLEMAAHGSGDTGHAPRSVIGRDEIGESIAAALRRRGYEVEAGYGLSDFSLDLVVREPGQERWQVAVVLDGPGWARRPTVADRDLTPGLLSQLMGWGASLRIWLPGWLDNAEGVLDEVDAAVAVAKQREAADRERQADAAAEQERNMEAARRQAEIDAASGDADDDIESDLDDAVEVETYVPANDFSDADIASADHGVYASAAATADIAASVESPLSASASPGPVDRDWDELGGSYVEEPADTLGERSDLDRTNSRAVRATITGAARRTVEQEGPIATDRLARSIARRFGFDRVPGARQRFILDLVPPELVHSSDLGDFVWPTQIDRGTWRGYRTTPVDFVRPLADIAPEEIINTMAAVVGMAPITDDEQLFRETLAVFGQKRLTGGSKERLESCRDRALAESRLTNDNGRYRAGA